MLERTTGRGPCQVRAALASEAGLELPSSRTGEEYRTARRAERKSFPAIVLGGVPGVVREDWAGSAGCRLLGPGPATATRTPMTRGLPPPSTTVRSWAALRGGLLPSFVTALGRVPGAVGGDWAGDTCGLCGVGGVGICIYLCGSVLVCGRGWVGGHMWVYRRGTGKHGPWLSVSQTQTRTARS